MQVTQVDETEALYCSQNAVESEMDVLMSCDGYMDINTRINLFVCVNNANL